VGRVVLVGRLAARDLRRHLGEAALLVLAMMAATTTLALGLALGGLTEEPYQRTREATVGPDVVALVAPDPFNDGAPADLSSLEALIDAPGVVAHGGPFPATRAVMEVNGASPAVQAIGRDVTAAEVDQPEVTSGKWVEDGAVVVEAAFADAAGVDVGDPVTLAGRSFRVSGLAVTATAPPYPEVTCFTFPCVGTEGLIWLTRSDLRSLVPDDDALGYVMGLRLADPAAAPAFVAAHLNHPPAPMGTFWQEILERTDRLVEDERRVLITGGWLLGVLAVASVAVVVGGRMAQQTRRVGLLKAVGGTPSLVAVVLLAEYVALALVAAAVGLAGGWLLAPTLTEPSVGLIGHAGTPPVTMSTVVAVGAVALGVAIAATLVPAIRAARTSTVRALADAARPPRRTRWLIAVSARLPGPLLLGVRVVARRPRRVVLTAASIFVTVSGIVAVLGARTELAAERVDGSEAGSRIDQLNQVLLVVTVTLVALAAVNAIVSTWATALDARHSSAMARALGATPGQVSAGLSAAQVLAAVAGAILGVPGGIALLAAVDPDAGVPLPPTWQLLAVVPGTAVVVAALTAIPARLSARRPVIETLQAEMA
jgi:ABC-type lipoprotein release transport system permease subunit